MSVLELLSFYPMIKAESHCQLLPIFATEEFMDQYPDVAPPFLQTARSLKSGKGGILSRRRRSVSHYATLLIQNFDRKNVLY